MNNAAALQVPKGFIILEQVVIEDAMETAAKVAKFWLSNPGRRILSGSTSLWDKRAGFAAKKHALKFAVPPGAVVVCKS